MSCRAWVVGGALACLPFAAHAEETALRAQLQLSRPASAAECIDRDALEASVETHLGRELVSSSPELLAEVVFARETAGWQAQVSLRTADGRVLGQRRLTTDAEHCSALDGPLALALALMVDLTREELPPPPPKPEPQPPPRPREIRVPADAPAPREPWRVGAAALGTAMLGGQPGLAWGGRLLLSATPPHAPRLELELGTFQRTTEHADAAGAGVRVRLVTLGTFVCPVGVWDDAVMLCVGQVLGRTDAEGFGFDTSRTQRRLSWALGGRLRAALSVLGPLEVRAGLGAEAPVYRDRFVYRQSGELQQVFRMSPVMGSAELGIGLSLP